MAKGRKKKKPIVREPGDMPTPEQIMKGEAVREFVTHAETATKAMAHRVSHDPIKRWEKDRKLTDLQIATIERMQTLWHLAYGEQKLTGGYSEPLGASGATECTEARQLALRDEVRAIESIFDGVRQWYTVFERICRFGHSPVEACGDRIKALTIVRFIADFIETKGV